MKLIKPTIIQFVNRLNSHIVLSRWIKYIALISVIIYCVVSIRQRYNRSTTTLDDIRNKPNAPISRNKADKIKLVTVQALFENLALQFSNLPLEELSGEYEEVPAISTMSNTIHQYVIEEIYFALTTKIERILNTVHFLKLWAKLPGIRCLIVFEEQDFVNKSNITKFLAREGIACKVQTSNVTHYEERYLELFKMAWNDQKTNDTGTERKKLQWFAVGDDDTVWFMSNLLETLRQYNSSNSIYLGDASDQTGPIAALGDYFAYGGGGVLLSRPLALLFAEHTHECKRFVDKPGGDAKIGKCVTEVLNISLTKNKYFHQMDHSGHLTGYLESGIDGLVSLHHILSWWKPFPNGHSDQLNETMHLIGLAYKTFDKRYLKRYVQFNHKTNRTLLLTMGYSFSLFQRILTLEELNQVELTWCCAVVTARKTRPAESKKVTWYFRDLTTETFNGSVRYKMTYENRREMCSDAPTIEVTLMN